MFGVGDPLTRHVVREYAVALMAAVAAWLAGLVAVVVLQPLGGHEDLLVETGTLAPPEAWMGFAAFLGATWVAIAPWLPERTWQQALVMGALGASMGFGYLVGGPDGATSLGLRLEGWILIVPLGVVLVPAGLSIDRVFATLRWTWMALIALVLMVQLVVSLGALAERISYVPLFYPLATGFLFSAATILRWAAPETAERDGGAVLTLGRVLVASLAAIGLMTGSATL